MRRGLIAAFAAAVLSAAAVAVPTGAYAQQWNWTNPTIKEFGAVVPLPNAALQPDKNVDYKVVFNVTSWGVPDKVEPGLERVARTVNLFTSAGVPVSRLHFIVVIHGPATPAVLDQGHYLEKYGMGNPNVDLIAALEQAGVQVVVCGQALAHHKFPDAWVNPEVEITLAAMTNLIILQQQGYVLVPL
jgi:intracellular sulfur oxidation DsrE/DsrF family protein